MVRNTLLILASAAILIAAAATFAPKAHQPAELRADAGYGYRASNGYRPHSYGYHTPNYGKGSILDRCFSEPIECGLVVW